MPEPRRGEEPARREAVRVGEYVVEAEAVGNGQESQSSSKDSIMKKRIVMQQRTNHPEHGKEAHGHREAVHPHR